MYSNGVSHLTVEDDIQGVDAIVKWLSCNSRNAVVPYQSCNLIILILLIEMLRFFNESKRSTAVPKRRYYAWDTTSEEQFLLVFLIKIHLLKPWGMGQTVITGRARLGGIPMGVIVPEARTVEYTIPADPASPLSTEQVVKQAGGVWFPDSAYKTSQAIHDFNREGLPLSYLLTGGLSGGQRDMFDEVLKFGATIVDALVQYKQPVFVYLPPNATPVVVHGPFWTLQLIPIKWRCMLIRSHEVDS